jgi:hypothetical protein
MTALRNMLSHHTVLMNTTSRAFRISRIALHHAHRGAHSRSAICGGQSWWIHVWVWATICPLDKVARVEQKHRRRRGRSLRAQLTVEVQHCGDYLGRTGSSLRRARTKARLEDIVVADRGKVVQRAEVAPP